MNFDRRHFLGCASALGCSTVLGQTRAVSPVLTASPSAAALEAQAPPMPPLGSRLALPEVPLLDGTRFTPAQAEGRVLVIYWWASDCPFCALQSPEIQKLWLTQRPRGLQLLTLSIDRHPEEAQAYLHKKGYTFPSGMATAAVQRVLPKPRGLPIVLVRGRDGTVLQAEKGQMFAEDVELLGRWLG